MLLSFIFSFITADFVTNREVVVNILGADWNSCIWCDFGSCSSPCKSANTLAKVKVGDESKALESEIPNDNHPRWSNEEKTFLNVPKDKLLLTVTLQIDDYENEPVSVRFITSITSYQVLQSSNTTFLTVLTNEDNNSVTLSVVVRCTVTECDYREANDTCLLESPLTNQEDDCFMQLSNGDPTSQCASKCVSPELYYPNISTGRCEFLPCTERRHFNSLDPLVLPCGQSCFLQMYNDSCAETCLDPAGQVESNNDTGKCEFKPCKTRTVILSSPLTTFPCGENDCFYQMYTDTCDTVCAHLNHVEPDNETGQCLFKDCVNRTYIEVSDVGNISYPCGDSCYLQYRNGAPTCDSTCRPTAHYEQSATGVCVFQDCSNRTYEASATYPCGERTECYLQLSDGYYTLLCGTDCRPSEHTVANNLTGRCDFRLCSNRTAIINSSVTNVSFPCGESTCMQQMYNTELTSDCDVGCVALNHTRANNATGVCELKDCSDRTANMSMLVPCAEDDCYQQLYNNTLSYECNNRCLSYSHTQPATNGSGVCELKNCTARKVNESTSFPCGEQNCYQQMFNAVLISDCNIDCLASSNTTEPVTEGAGAGTCKLKDCDKRHTDTSPGVTYPCGDGSACYQQMYDAKLTYLCSPVCVASNHTQPNPTTRQCELKNCTKRTVNISTAVRFPCAESTCFLQMDGEKCDDSCPIPNHYQSNNDTGICELKDCPLRMEDNTSEGIKYPCGEKCYLQEGICQYLCTEYHVPDGDTGRCRVSECAKLTGPNCQSETENITCFIYIETGGGGGSGTTPMCVEECPSLHYVNNSRNECELRNCTERKYNETAQYVCGSDECYYHRNKSCSTTLPTSNEYADEHGIISLIKCANRTAIETTPSAPCGTGECFVQPHEQGCAYDFCPLFYNKEVGTCTPMLCTDREPMEAAIDGAPPSCLSPADVAPKKDSGATDTHVCMLENNSCILVPYNDNITTPNSTDGGDDPNRSKGGSKSSLITVIVVVVIVVLVVTAVVVVIIVVMVKRNKEKKIGDVPGEGTDTNTKGNVGGEKLEEGGGKGGGVVTNVAGEKERYNYTTNKDDDNNNYNNSNNINDEDGEDNSLTSFSSRPSAVPALSMFASVFDKKYRSHPTLRKAQEENTARTDDSLRTADSFTLNEPTETRRTDGNTTTSDSRMGAEDTLMGQHFVQSGMRRGKGEGERGEEDDGESATEMSSMSAKSTKSSKSAKSAKSRKSRKSRKGGKKEKRVSEEEHGGSGTNSECSRGSSASAKKKKGKGHGKGGGSPKETTGGGNVHADTGASVEDETASMRSVRSGRNRNALLSPENSKSNYKSGGHGSGGHGSGGHGSGGHGSGGHGSGGKAGTRSRKGRGVDVYEEDV